MDARRREKKEEGGVGPLAVWEWEWQIRWVGDKAKRKGDPGAVSIAF